MIPSTSACENGHKLEAKVRSILVQSTAAAEANGFGERLHQRFGMVLGNDLIIKRDQDSSKPDLFD